MRLTHGKSNGAAFSGNVNPLFKTMIQRIQLTEHATASIDENCTQEVIDALVAMARLIESQRVDAFEFRSKLFKQILKGPPNEEFLKLLKPGTVSRLRGALEYQGKLLSTMTVGELIEWVNEHRTGNISICKGIGRTTMRDIDKAILKYLKDQ